jgi:glucose dehydrogenase
MLWRIVMRKSWIFAVAGVALLSALLVQVGPAQQGKGKATKAAAKQTSIPPGDWPLYSRDLASDRFSPLTQINTTNVAQLTQAWSYRPPAPPPPPDNGKGGGKGKGKGGGAGGIGAEVTPIVVNGVMYVPAGTRVLALEADTGKEIWTYTAPGAVANRAVGYWPGDGTNPSRVVFMTGLRERRNRRNRIALGWCAIHLQEPGDPREQQRRKHGRSSRRHACL